MYKTIYKIVKMFRSFVHYHFDKTGWVTFKTTFDILSKASPIYSFINFDLKHDYNGTLLLSKLIKIYL